MCVYLVCLGVFGVSVCSLLSGGGDGDDGSDDDDDGDERPPIQHAAFLRAHAVFTAL